MEFSIKKPFKSNDGEEDISHEELLILLDQDHRHYTQPMTDVDLSDRREVIIKIDEGADSSASTSDLAKNDKKIWRQSSIDFWHGDGNGAGNADNFDFVQLRKTEEGTGEDPPEEPDFKLSRIPQSGQIPKLGQMRSWLLCHGGDDDDDDPFLEEDVPHEYKRTNFNALTLLQWVSLVLIIGAVVCTLTIPILREKSLWKLKLWKWEVLILVLICGRLVLGWGIRIIVFFVGVGRLVSGWGIRIIVFFINNILLPIARAIQV